MEIIIGIIIIGLGYALYRTFQPKATVVETAVAYKVEAPVVAVTLPVAVLASSVKT